MKWIVSICFLIAVGDVCHGMVRDLVESIKVITVNSVSQKIIDQKTIELEGDVDIWVDRSLHVWADKVIIDREAKTLKAFPKKDGAVVVESDGMVLLVDYADLDISKRTGYAKNIRAHVMGSYIAAKEGHKLNEYEWKFTNVQYTACDKDPPHWQMCAQKAHVSKFTISIQGITLRLGPVPIFFFPRITVPGPNQSRTGFLLPKINWSRTLGLGVTQEFYADLTRHVDTTVGVNWREHKGTVLYNETRYAQSPHDFGIVNSQYAFEKHSYVEKNNKISQQFRRRYWIDGQYITTFTLDQLSMHSLLRFGFGTDQTIGYEFFHVGDKVEDTFNNDAIVRFPMQGDALSLSVLSNKIIRGSFAFAAQGIKHEEEETFHVLDAPRIDWNSIYRRLGNGISYRHDIVIDQVGLRRQTVQKTYEHALQIAETEPVPFRKDDSVRFIYAGTIDVAVNTHDHRVVGHILPQVHVRGKSEDVWRSISNDKAAQGRFGGEGQYSVFVGADASWYPPLYVRERGVGNIHYIQPSFHWRYTPQFDQSNWLKFDRLDFVWPSNEVSAEVRYDWYFDQARLTLAGRQGFDFFRSDSWFWLRRTRERAHATPLYLDAEFDRKHFQLGVHQEYDVRRVSLLDASYDIGVCHRGLEFNTSLLYVGRGIAPRRNLLMVDIPWFARVGGGVYMYRNTRLEFDSTFYSSDGSLRGIFVEPRTLRHRINLDHKGHCYSIYLGLEDKRFRQEGMMKSERTYIFGVKLTSIGSFTRRQHKEPTILNAPPGY